MINSLKRLAGKLPLTTQQYLKRTYFALQIRRGTFTTDEMEFQLLSDWISSGDWALDVGANIGHYSARLSNLVGPQGRVIAFEPIPETFELLAANVARFQHSNVTLINAAASNSTCMLGMEIPHFDSGLSNYYMANIVNRQSDASVLSIPVDALSIPNTVRLVKIDVEGHELQALHGMKELLQRDGPRLIVEGESDEVLNFLEDLGYTFHKLSDSSNRIYSMQT